MPDFVDALRLVGGRIDRLWDSEGTDYPFGDAPDDNDPSSIRQRRIDYLVPPDNLEAHLPEFVEILLSSQDMHDASTIVAPLLGLQEEEALYRLNT